MARKIYLDVSCLNRPFDDQRQPRIRLESEAVTMLLEGIDAGRWEQVSSLMAEIEIAADAVHLAAAEALQADVLVTCDDRLLRRCNQIADELKVRVANPIEWLKEHDDATNPG